MQFFFCCVINWTVVKLDIKFYRQYKAELWKRFLINIRLHRLFRQRLANKILEISPDIILCTRIDYIRDVVKVKGDIPLIFESHSSCLATSFDRASWLRRIRIHNQKNALNRVDVVVALTKGDAVEWKKLTNKVAVIPNVVNLNKTSKCTNHFSRSIIYVGRDTEQKDLESLLRVWNLVYKKHPECLLHIYGNTCKKAEGVVVHEPTNRMDEVYSNASMLLLTSLYEPFGLVLVEAMSYGLPVVAFDCPYGPADIISNGVDGFVIRDRNVMEFANCVCKLIEDDNLRFEMGKAGLLSSQRYCAEQIMPKWIKLFEMIIGDSI